MTLITTDTILSLKPLEAFVGIGGVPVKIHHASWPKGSDIDAIVARELAPASFTATSDGRGMLATWHEGAEAGEAVYFERYKLEDGPLGGRYVRVSHGWVDGESRKIVQTG